MPDQTILNIGFDDTDSPKGMCTTFLAFKIVGLLHRQETEFLDFPRLIRFNPNIPWKTRGNGAVSLRVKTRDHEKIKQEIKRLVSKYSDVENGANPGLVFFEGDQIPKDLADFSNLALWQLINRKHAKKFAKKGDLEFFYHGNGQGLVGAIGAIGYEFGDSTLELLSYRRRSKFGTPRNISAQSVRLMQEKTFPQTFNSFDAKKGRILIAPRGPDPVFYGIRGEDVGSLLSASKMIETDERLSGFMIFKSNQGTGDHLKNYLNPEDLRPYYSGKLVGTVSGTPHVTRGGHAFFKINSKNSEINCAVYKPTGLAHAASKLIKGDKLLVAGGVRKASKLYQRTLNLELIKILRLEKNLVLGNPYCKGCQKSMKSKGRHQGFQCVACGRRSKDKIILERTRDLRKKSYLPLVSAHRHLTRPAQRMGLKNDIKFEHSSWFSIN